MRRYIAGEAVYKEKPQNEVDALIEIISAANPDILGVCEIGKYADLTDLQNRLAAAGVKLPHAHRVHGSDPTRALALLSRYPIVKTNSPKQTRLHRLKVSPSPSAEVFLMPPSNCPAVPVRSPRRPLQIQTPKSRSRPEL